MRKWRRRPQQQRDHVYQQTGYVGSSPLFHNGDAKHTLQSLPPEKLNDALAITFCTDLPVEDVDHGREAVRKIVQLRVRKDRLLQQAQVLMDTNVVYAAGVTKIDNEQLTKWLGGEDDVVPPAVLDCVAIMLQKLEELEAAGARSVAVEMASLMEEDTVLLDHLVAAHGAQKTDHGTPHSAHSRSAVMPHAGQMTLQRWRKKDVCTVARSRHFHTHHLSHATLSHTHTCSETAYRIIDVECIKRAKNTSVKSDRNGWMIRSEKLCEGNLSTSLLEGSLSLCSFGCSAGFPHQDAQAQQSGHRLLLLSLFVSFREMDDDDMKPEVKEGTEKGKNRTCIPLANRVPRTHTHTLAQKYLIELLMWNASNVQKTPQLNLTGTVG